MKEYELPSGIIFDNQYLSFNQVHRRFAESSHGVRLGQNIRYALFKPDGVSNQEWEKTLGIDVNNLHHLNLSLGMTRSFLANCATPDTHWKGIVPTEAVFTAQEQQLLLLTAAVHDWAEAVVGDIPYHDKTQSDEELEMTVLRGLVHEVLGNGTRSVQCDEIADGVQSVLTDTTSKLGRAFNAVERVGYVRTGLRAWNQSKVVNGQLGSSLERLARNVIPFHTTKLVDYAEIYPPVDSYLSFHHGSISQIISTQDGGSNNHIWFTRFSKGNNNNI